MQVLQNIGSKRPLLAGYCRNEFEAGHKPVVFNEFSVLDIESTLKYPKTIKEKANHLLRHCYEHGGQEGQRFKLQNGVDYPLCYCSGLKDFDAVIDNLVDRDLIDCTKTVLSGYHNHFNFRLKSGALDALENHLAQGPMLGLTSQSIVLSEPEWNTRVGHAVDLFDEQPRTKERMRSAVLELCAVLEPVRAELEGNFGKKDTNTFFQLVNEFDIRHNKNEIGKIEHEEQLEWLYYAFLNTLNTYAKLERKLNPDW